MKTNKYSYWAAGLVLMGSVAYLQLGTLPSVRQRLLEELGTKAGVAALASTAFACLEDGDMAALALAAASLSAFLLAGFSGMFLQTWSGLQRSGREWCLPAIVVAAASLPYLSRGNVMLGDAMQFSALTAYMRDSLLNMSLPYWSFHFYLGFPPYAFFGWLFWALAGSLGLLLSLDLSNKLLFYTLQIGSALAAYAFTKARAGDARVAVVAALAYGLSFEHFAKIFTGRSFLALTYLLAPLLFLAFELGFQRRLGRGAAIAAMASLSSLLMFTHQVDGAFTISIFALYAALRGGSARQLRAVGGEVLAAFLLAALITSFWTIPLIFELGEVSSSSKATDILRLKAPQPDAIVGLLLPVPLRERSLYYVGVSILALAAVGGLWLWRQKKRELPVVALASLAAVLVQSNRHMPALLLMVAVSAGYGLLAINASLGKERLFAVVTIIILDVVPMTAQLGYPDFSYLKEFYATLQARGGERVLDLSTDRRTFWPNFIYVYGKDEAVFGPHIESASRGLALSVAIAQRAAQEHYDKAEGFSDMTLDGLYLLGVKHVILHDEHRTKRPAETFREKRGGFGLERGLRLYEMPEHSLIIAAPRLLKVAEPSLQSKEAWGLKAAYEQRAVPFDEVRQILELMRPNRASATAAAIPIVNGEEDQAGAGAELIVRRVTTDIGKVRIEYTSSETYLQLNYTHSKHLGVMIDGREVPYLRTAMGTIAVKTASGTHVVEIEGRLSILRKLTFLTSALGVLVAAVLLIFALHQNLYRPRSECGD